MADIKVGGWSQTKDADKETQWICDQMKSLVEGKTHKIYQEYKAVEYVDQIVAGKNFLIKVHVGGHNYIHLFVFRDLPCKGGRLELLGVQQHRTKDDPLEPFNN